MIIKNNTIFLLRNKRLAGLFVLLSSFVLTSFSVITYSKVAGVFLNPTATISISSENICSGAQATITLKGSGGVAPYTFRYKINGTVQDEITTITGGSVSFPTEIDAAGSYTYGLVEIRDANDATQEYINQEKMVEVTVTDPPVVGFIFNNDGACSGETVEFTSDVVGSGTYEYHWKFGDGNTSTLKNPTHIYNATGTGTETFFVQLSVSDGDNCTANATKEIVVQEKPVLLFIDHENPPRQFRNCGVSPDPDDPDADDFAISVRNASSNTSAIDADSYTIDWGDGTSSQQVSFPAPHTYTSIGDYNMVISATGTNGCAAQKTYLVLNSSNPAAGFGTVGSTQNVCIGSELGFKISNFSENNASTTYTIDWGDGGQVEVYTQEELSTYVEETENTDFEVTHIYNSGSCALENGSFTATLRASNSCPNPTIISIRGITVLAKPVSNFEIETVLPGCPDVPIEFTNTSFVGDSDSCSKYSLFTWDFGDGSDEVTVVAYQANPDDSQSHAYTEPGTYDVVLTSEGRCGTVSVTKQVTIEPSVVASFDIDSDGEGCIDFVVKATNTIDESVFNEPLTYNWTVSYSKDNCGTSGDWIFLNGTNASSENPQFQFKSPGSYTITQSIPSYCNTGTADKTVIVKQPPEVAIIPFDDFCQPGVIKPTASIGNCTPNKDEVTYSWTFEGGTPSVSTLETPENITYSTPGSYTVTLAVTNACGTVTDTQKFEVLEKPILTNTPSAQEICSNQSTSAISLTSNTANSTFRWTATTDADISGFIESGTTQVIPSQRLLNSGTTQGTVEYVALPILNGCEGDPITFTVLVNATPIITTQPVSSAICVDGTATLLEVVTQNGVGTPTYQWFLNDSNSMIGSNPIDGANSSTYTATTEVAGEVFYYVVISFGGGCEDLASSIVSVDTLEQPTAVAINATQTFCAGGDAYEFSFNLFGGVGTPTYQWYSNTTDSNSGGTPLEDATNSTYIPADATFVNTGVFYYYVIVALDGVGCSNAISNTFEVNVVPDPVIDSQPIVAQEICQNIEAQALEVAISKKPIAGTFSYQWYSSATNTNTGGTEVSTNYPFIPPTDTVGTLYYYVVVSQKASGCEVVSATSEIKVTAIPTIIKQPVSSAVCINGTATLLEVDTQDGIGTPTYQWFSNENNSLTGSVLMESETNSSYMPSTDTISEVFYYVVISFEGACIDLISNIVFVNTLTQPTATTVNTLQTICEAGAASEFNINLSGGAGIPSYQWYSNTTNSNTDGIKITGATSSTYIAASDPFINTGNFYYYVVVNFAGGTGCSKATSNPFEVIVVPDPVIDSQPIVTQELCENIRAEALEVTPSGDANTGGFSYQWYSNTTNTTTGGTPVSNSIAYTPPTGAVGTLYYYVIVSQAASGCEVVSETAEIKVNPTPTITTQPISSAVCTDGVAVLLQVETQDGVGTPAYQWFSNNSNSMSGSVQISNATNRTYTAPTDTAREFYYYVEISFAGGCAYLTSDIAFVNTLDQAIATADNASQTICEGGAASEFNITLRGGAGTPSYQWYSNTTDSNNGGLLMDGATNSSYTAVSETFSNTRDFYYYVIVDFPFRTGCSEAISDTFEVIVVPDPVINSQPMVSQELCENIRAQALEVTPSGKENTGVFNYQWYSNTTNTTTEGTPVSTRSTYLPPTGTVGTLYYYVVVSQTASGCEVVSDTAEIKVNPTPKITTQPAASDICIGEAATLLEVLTENEVGTPTYQWFSNDTNSITGSALIAGETNNTYSAPIDTIGIAFYHVVISFEGGCANLISNIVPVKINEIPVIDFGEVTIYSEETFSFDPATIDNNEVPDGTTYTWTTPTSSILDAIVGSSEETFSQPNISQTLTNLEDIPVIETYTITPTSPNCIGDSFIREVTVNPSIKSNIVITNNSCFESNDGTITTNIVGGVPFETGAPYLISWTGPNGFTSSEATIINLFSGDYTLTIEDENSETITEKHNVTQPDLLTITTDLEKDISCFKGSDGAIEVTFTGGTLPYTFNWTTTDGSGLVLNTKRQNTLTKGTYVLEITDANNCVQSETFTLTQPDIILIETELKVDVLCFGEANGSIDVNVSGGTPLEVTPGNFQYSYNWTGPNGYVSASENPINLFAGTYTLEITDNLGCIQTADFIIEQPTALGVSFTKIDATCYEAADGFIEVTATGGTAPYQITWSNLGNKFSQSNLIAGIYNATVTDDHNCKITISITIEHSIFYAEPTVKPISCNGEIDGAISLNIVGGVAPLRVIWSDDASAGFNRTNLGPGTYSVIILDSGKNNCPIEQTFLFTNPAAIAVSSVVVDAVDCSIANSGSIDLDISGGTAPYRFIWNSGQTTEDINNIPEGDYSVQIEDVNGCLASREFTIFRQDPSNISFTETVFTDCNLNTIQVQNIPTVTGGFLPYTYSWSDGTISGSENEIMTTDQSGSYTLTITDGQGCVETVSIQVDVPITGNPDFSFSSFSIREYGIISINDPIQFTDLSTGDYESVSWAFGDGSPIVDAIDPIHIYEQVGTFTITLTVLYVSGCVYETTRTISTILGYSLVLPNAFTPNGDAINDVIRPSYRGFDDIEMSIYDTWGTLLYFEKGIILQGWKGYIRGNPAENGNYIMNVKGITFYGLEIKESSTIILLK
jgi:gliding motility-associated-like protein